MIGILIAAGVFISAFGWQLNPMLGAAAMSLSSFCVVMNALRLNLFRPHDAKNDKKLKHPYTGEIPKINSRKESNDMKKTMKIEGMMCAHCEARVKKALEAIDGVISAAPDHEKNEAVLVLSKDVDYAVLKAAVEKEGYDVKGIVGE